MPDRALTVTQLNEYVGTLLSGDPLLRGLKVQGELSGFKRHTSGHIYFSLKDETAVVRCVMFRTAAQSLNFVPQDGMRVLATGYAALYVRDGQYQLYVQSMQKEGEGELYRRFLLLKTKLEAMGYFNPDHKRPIPFLPQCVGIVTSPTGAALQDILQIIRRRFPRMDMQICPVLVQGAGAAENIAAGIRAMNQLGRASVLIVGRGGGSIEDLWAFNEVVVAKAIYESHIPVISAVGHETDFSIADFTADLRAPTPSAAAELCVPEYDALLQHTDGLVSERLPRALNRSIVAKRDRLLLLLHARGFSAAEHSVALKRQILENTIKRLRIAAAHSLLGQRAVIRGLIQRLQPLSPDAALQRGFAMVGDGAGNILSSISDLAPDMEIMIRMHGGEANARVEHIQPNGTGR
ncbi:MAG: exodeoxyribonuclease VII large subunit [Bacillota bacterium]